MKNGVLLINKPRGITSHDVVDEVRKKFKMRRVGHAGTLDPLATGLIIVLVGRSTKLFQNFAGLDKKYDSTLKLGEVTASGDTQGKVIDSNDKWKNVSEEDLMECFSKFKGEIHQIPPQVSALRHKGKRLYDLARQGKTVALKPRKINIYSLEIEKIEFPFVDFSVFCSKGTYIRKLAHDIGQCLGCGACVTRINRVQIGDLYSKDAVELEDLDENCFIEW